MEGLVQTVLGLCWEGVQAGGAVGGHLFGVLGRLEMSWPGVLAPYAASLALMASSVGEC